MNELSIQTWANPRVCASLWEFINLYLPESLAISYGDLWF